MRSSPSAVTITSAIAFTSSCNTISNSVRVPVPILWSIYPRHETSSTAPGRTAIENSPSERVATPFEVPRSTMVAPATGSPDSSATRPLTTTFRGGDWACAAMSGNRHRQASRAAMHFHPLCSGHNFLRQYVKGITIMEQLSTKL